MRIFLLFYLILTILGAGNNTFAAELSSGNVNIAGVQGQNCDVQREKALSFYQTGNYREALLSFKNIDAALLKPTDYLVIANSYESLNNVRKASEVLIKAIELNPKYSKAYYNLGILHFKNNDFKTAIENLEKAVKYDKSFVPALYNIGCCYLAINDYKMSKSYFLKTIKADPEFFNAYYNLGLSFEGFGKSKEAQKYFDMYKRLKPEMESINN